jgi:hypothetical protein
MKNIKSDYIEPKLTCIVFDANDIITASGPVTEEAVPPDIGNMDDSWT